MNASSAMPFPLPNSCGKNCPSPARSPNAPSGATCTCRPRARWWETKAISRMNPTATMPISGPATTVHTSADTVSRWSGTPR